MINGVFVPRNNQSEGIGPLYSLVIGKERVVQLEAGLDFEIGFICFLMGINGPTKYIGPNGRGIAHHKR